MYRIGFIASNVCVTSLSKRITSKFLPLQANRFLSNDTYVGDLIEGKKHGKGKWVMENGAIYEGNFMNDMRYGVGKNTHPSGIVYEGEWKEDKPHGQGKLILSLIHI